MREEPEEQRETGAEQEAGNDREIKRGVFAAMDDVAGEAAEAEREFSAEIKKSTQNDEKSTENENSAAEFANGVHSGILPQAAGKPFGGHIYYLMNTLYIRILL
jgi:hypothetical protein